LPANDPPQPPPRRSRHHRPLERRS
jgi:hypothetical protein